MRGQKLVSVIDFEEVKRLFTAVVRQYQAVSKQLNDMTAAMNNAEAKKLRGPLEKGRRPG